jgi:hypothetical protein
MVDMRRMVWAILPWMLSASEPAPKPKGQAAPTKSEPATPRQKPAAKLDPRTIKLEDATSASSAQPDEAYVTEMKVESATKGVSRETGGKAKPIEVHGEAIAGGAASARGASGSVSVQDKKKGKWAISAEAGKATQNRNK